MAGYNAKPISTQLTTRRSNKTSIMTQINVNGALALAMIYDYVAGFFSGLDIAIDEYYEYYFNY